MDSEILESTVVTAMKERVKMNRGIWNDLFERIGIVAIIASLIFVGLQVRQDQNIAVAQILAEHDGNLIEMANLVSDNREIWIRGLEGEELSKLDELAFQTMADTTDRLLSNRFNRTQLLDTFPGDLVAQRYAFRLYTFPGLRRIYEVKKARRLTHNSGFNGTDVGGSAGFRIKVDRYLVELDTGSPPAYEEKGYVVW